MAPQCICSEAHRLERIEGKLDAIGEKINPRLAVVESKVSALEEQPATRNTAWQTIGTLAAVIISIIALFWEKTK